MYCPFCRAELPEGSKFCMSCGKAMPAAPANASPNPPTTGIPPAGGPRSASGDIPGPARDQADAAAHDPWIERPAAPRPAPVPAEPETESRLVPALAAVLAVLLLAAGGLWLLNRSHGAPVTAVRSAPVPGPSVVRAPAAPPGPPVTAQPGRPAPAKPQGMPEDVRRYLSFLQGIEAQRKDEEGKLTNKMLAMIPNLLMPNFDAENVQRPDQQMAQTCIGMANEYSRATQLFQYYAGRVGVPESCRKLHAYYSTAFSLYPRLIGQIAGSVQSNNYSGLLSMRGSVGKQIDDNLQAADQELGNICAQYNVPKPFTIGNTSGGDSVLLP